MIWYSLSISGAQNTAQTAADKGSVHFARHPGAGRGREGGQHQYHQGLVRTHQWLFAGPLHQPSVALACLLQVQHAHTGWNGIRGFVLNRWNSNFMDTKNLNFLRSGSNPNSGSVALPSIQWLPPCWTTSPAAVFPRKIFPITTNPLMNPFLRCP